MPADLCRCGLPKCSTDDYDGPHGKRLEGHCYGDWTSSGRDACDRRAVARIEAFLREHGQATARALNFAAYECSDANANAAEQALSALLRDYGIGGEGG